MKHSHDEMNYEYIQNLRLARFNLRDEMRFFFCGIFWWRRVRYASSPTLGGFSRTFRKKTVYTPPL